MAEEAGILLDAQTFARLENALLLVERYLPLRPDHQHLKPALLPERTYFYNNSGEVIPAYGCMAVTGSTSIEGRIYHVVSKPSSTFVPLYLPNGPQEIAVGATASIAVREHYRWLYQGTVTSGDGFGPTPGQWYLTENQPSVCEVVGTYDSTTLVGTLHPVEVLLGKPAGTIANGASGTVNIWSGTAGSEAVITSMTVSAHNKGAEVTTDSWVQLHSINGIWYIGTGSGPDIFVAIESGNTTGYLKDQFRDFNASAQYEVNKDPLIEVELIGSAPNKNVQLFIDANSWPGYSAGGAVQSFGKVTADAITWFGYSATNPWITVAYSGGNILYSHAGPNSGETTTVIGATVDKASGSPDTTSFNFTSSANAGAKWAITSYYQSGPGADVELFAGLTTYDSLGHATLLGGEVSAGSIVMPVNTDIFVAVEATNTAGYLFDQFQDVNASAQYESGKDLLVEIERVGANPDKNLRGFADSNSYPNYNAGSAKVLGKGTDDLIIWQGFGGHSWINIAYDAAGAWNITHIGPVSGETATTIGTNDEKANATPDSTALDLTATTNAGAFWFLDNFYQATSNDDINLYFRKCSFDTLGHVFAVSGESDARTITINADDIKVKVSSGDAVTDFLTNKVAAAATDGTRDWIDKAIDNPGSDEDLLIKHVGPKNESWGSAVILGSSGTYAEENTTFTASGSNFVSVNLMTRTEWDNSVDPPVWYEYTRVFRFDRKGHLYSVSDETRRSVVTPVPCDEV